MRRNVTPPTRTVLDCRIRIKGCLPGPWSDWLGGLNIHAEPAGVGLLAGRLPDQAALFGVLERLRDAGVELVGISCFQHLEDAPGPEQALEE